MRIKNKRIEEVVVKMLADHKLGYQYFGEFLTYVNIDESDKVPTMGVNVSRRGMNLYYNQEFTESLSDKELAFVLVHEIMHLQHRHTFRSVGFKQDLANIAQDMIINTIIDQETPKSFADFGNLEPLFIPKEYKGRMVFEELYEWLDTPENEEKYGGGKTLDEHMLEDLPQEVADAIVREVKEALRNRGVQTGAAEGLLNKIEKPKKDYIREIKKHVSRMKGFVKQKTYSRLNRKGLEGLKGNKKAGIEIAVLLDTSGSMMGSFEKVLGTIYQNNITSNVVLVDTEIKGVEKVSCKKDVQKIVIKGYGGTELQPGIEYYKQDKKLSQMPLLILTDGYCDHLNLSGITQKCMVITVGVKVTVTGKDIVQVCL